MDSRASTLAAKPDGRRARATESRRRIVEAMLALVREGDMTPTADAVADRAAVGRRTVFRLFKDMESVYAEIQADMLHRIQPLRSLPIEGSTLAERLDRLIDRRVRLFEEILPVKVAADLHRHRSPFLMQSHQFMGQQLRAILADILQPRGAAAQVQLEALDAVLSIDMWRRLRRDQGLSVPEAEAILRRLGAALLQ